MAKLRDAVYAADQSGNGVEKALQDLRAYVNNHMNTSLDNGKGVYPPVQLKYTYDRLVQAEQDRVSATNAKIYTDGQAYCETLNPTSFYGRDRVGCIQDYIKSHGTATAKNIPDALYKFDFVSPRWSPDVAGLALAASIVALVFTVIRFALGKWLQAATK